MFKIHWFANVSFWLVYIQTCLTVCTVVRAATQISVPVPVSGGHVSSSAGTGDLSCDDRRRSSVRHFDTSLYHNDCTANIKRWIDWSIWWIWSPPPDRSIDRLSMMPSSLHNSGYTDRDRRESRSMTCDVTSPMRPARDLPCHVTRRVGTMCKIVALVAKMDEIINNWHSATSERTKTAARKIWRLY